MDKQQLRHKIVNEAKKCRNVNACVLLQEIARWLEGETIFDEKMELWEHADRLCQQTTAESIATRPACGIHALDAIVHDDCPYCIRLMERAMHGVSDA